MSRPVAIAKNIGAAERLAVNPDHGRQEQVWEAVQHFHGRQPWRIRQLLTETSIPASDKRAQFVGVEAYQAAGGERRGASPVRRSSDLHWRDVFGRISVDQFDIDSGMRFCESIQKFAQKAGGDRGENASPDPSFSPVRDDGGISGPFPNMTKHALRSRQKALAGVCELNASTASVEDGHAKMALEVANAAADRRFLNAESNAGLAEAAMLDRRHKITQMPSLDRSNLSAIHGCSAQGSDSHHAFVPKRGNRKAFAATNTVTCVGGDRHPERVRSELCR